MPIRDTPVWRLSSLLKPCISDLKAYVINRSVSLEMQVVFISKWRFVVDGTFNAKRLRKGLRLSNGLSRYLLVSYCVRLIESTMVRTDMLL